MLIQSFPIFSTVWMLGTYYKNWNYAQLPLFTFSSNCKKCWLLASTAFWNDLNIIGRIIQGVQEVFTILETSTEKISLQVMKIKPTVWQWKQLEGWSTLHFALCNIARTLNIVLRKVWQYLFSIKYIRTEHEMSIMHLYNFVFLPYMLVIHWGDVHSYEVLYWNSDKWSIKWRREEQ